MPALLLTLRLCPLYSTKLTHNIFQLCLLLLCVGSHAMAWVWHSWGQQYRVSSLSLRLLGGFRLSGLFEKCFYLPSHLNSPKIISEFIMGLITHACSYSFSNHFESCFHSPTFRSPDNCFCFFFQMATGHARLTGTPYFWCISTDDSLTPRYQEMGKHPNPVTLHQKAITDLNSMSIMSYASCVL